MNEHVGAIILAAGSSERMEGVDKMLASLGGRALVAASIDAFASTQSVDELVVVASEANRAEIEAIVAESAPAASVVLGGKRRRDSVQAGLDALSGSEYVVVHDGARPFVTTELIDACLAGARETGAALCAVPVTDTVKRGDEGGLVRGTVSRENLWLAQTPQAFRRDLLLQAHGATDIDATDDAALIELMEAPVRIVMGTVRNLKVTTQADLALAEALLKMATDSG
jgi:2-C-methyl-D-erythritol 4-phosphate cytidylyltransferase